MVDTIAGVRLSAHPGMTILIFDLLTNDGTVAPAACSRDPTPQVPADQEEGGRTV